MTGDEPREDTRCPLCAANEREIQADAVRYLEPTLTGRAHDWVDLALLALSAVLVALVAVAVVAYVGGWGQ